MTRTVLAAAVAAGLLGATGASAAIQTFSGDSDFLAAAGAHDSVGEFRWGNNALNGDWEIAVGFPTSNTPTQTIKQFVWTGSLDFTLSYDGANMLTLDYGASTPLTYTDAGVDFSAYNALALRTDGRKGDSIITDVNFGGYAPQTLEATSSVEYLVFDGVDTTSPWSLSGTIDFAAQDNNRGSQPSLQIKMADVAPIPVPAALPLALLGLGGFGLYARRQRRAA